MQISSNFTKMSYEIASFGLNYSNPTLQNMQMSRKFPDKTKKNLQNDLGKMFVIKSHIKNNDSN